MTTTLTQTRTRTREPRRQPYVNAPLDGYRSDMEVQWASLFVCLCRLDSWKCITSQRPKVGSGAATTHHRRARALLFLAAAFPSDSRGEGHTLPRFSLSLSLSQPRKLLRTRWRSLNLCRQKCQPPWTMCSRTSTRCVRVVLSFGSVAFSLFLSLILSFFLPRGKLGRAT